MANREVVETPTSEVEARCSIQLSYRSKMVEDEGNAPTQVTKDTGFTVPPAYFNGLILQNGCSGKIRTCDLEINSFPLLPAELPSIEFLFYHRLHLIFN